MSTAQVRQVLHAMHALEGVAGAALVDEETGMVWHACGFAQGHAVCEAASDYWRLCQRHRLAFAGLGALRAQVAIHAQGRLTLVACGPGLLLVALSEEPDRVDWARWKQLAGSLQAITARL